MFSCSCRPWRASALRVCCWHRKVSPYQSESTSRKAGCRTHTFLNSSAHLQRCRCHMGPAQGPPHLLLSRMVTLVSRTSVRSSLTLSIQLLGLLAGSMGQNVQAISLWLICGCLPFVVNNSSFPQRKNDSFRPKKCN